LPQKKNNNKNSDQRGKRFCRRSFGMQIGWEHKAPTLDPNGSTSRSTNDRSRWCTRNPSAIPDDFCILEDTVGLTSIDVVELKVSVTHKRLQQLDWCVLK
jgi:hypothetical protein